MRERIRIARWTVLIVPLVLTGCPTPGDQPSDQRAAVDREAEEQEIRQISERALEAIRRGDVEAAAALYSNDAIAAFPFQAQMRGRDAIRESLSEFVALPGLELDWTADRIEVSERGDMAYETGLTRYSFEMEGERVQQEAAYTLVYRKIDGQWRGVAESITPTSPPPGAPESPPMEGPADELIEDPAA